MGKKKHRNKNARSQEQREYSSVDRVSSSNALFERYYQNQHIVLEAEWSQFLETMRQDLPQSWRFVGGKE